MARIVCVREIWTVQTARRWEHDLVSPYVRRQQLAAALIEAREAAGLTHAQLAAKIGQSRQKISRLENGHIRPDQADIFKILDVLGVSDAQWSYLVEVAGDAADKGWWASYGVDMGARQAVYADLESGAHLIREFQLFIPGLLQTPDFHRQRYLAEIGPDVPSDDAHADRVVAARQTRQRMMLRAGDPNYEVVIDEVAIRRAPAPPDIFAAQLRRLVELRSATKITIRVLPVNATIRGYRTLRTSFSLYTYPDLDDPKVVAADTVTADVVLTSLAHREQVERYIDLYERVVEASLSPDDSTQLLATTATQLLEEARQ